MEHVKPHPNWVTLHAVVAVFSDYICGRFDSYSNRNARFDLVFDSNASSRFAGPYNNIKYTYMIYVCINK